MKKRPISTDAAPAAIGPYAQAVSVEGPSRTLYCSGQIPIDPVTGHIEIDDVAAATRACLKNLSAVLGADGMSLANVVRTTIYLVDMADFAVVNDAYAEAFPGSPPARACVAVAGLPKGVRVEIDAIAVSK